MLGGITAKTYFRLWRLLRCFAPRNDSQPPWQVPGCHCGGRLEGLTLAPTTACGSFRKYGVRFTGKPFRKLVATGLRAGRSRAGRGLPSTRPCTGVCCRRSCGPGARYPLSSGALRAGEAIPARQSASKMPLLPRRLRLALCAWSRLARPRSLSGAAKFLAIFGRGSQPPRPANRQARCRFYLGG